MTCCWSGMSTPVTRVPADFTSVTYTMPASASPRVTLLSTARTSTSWLATLTLTPAFRSDSRAYLPAGTVGAARTTMSPGFARSARPVIPLGFPVATAICSRLLTKAAGAPSVSFASTTFCMLVSSADANTSAVAPLLICVSSGDDDPKLKTYWVPGFFSLSSSPAFLNASVSDEPANTVMLPASGTGVTDADADGATDANEVAG